MSKEKMIGVVVGVALSVLGAMTAVNVEEIKAGICGAAQAEQAK